MGDMTRIAVVLWSGVLGGAETFTVDLCRTMHALGTEVGVVFITHDEPLGNRLSAAGIPHRTLKLTRGRQVIRNPRALARAVEAMGPGGALLPHAGYLSAALRIGGYRGRIVAVGHDAVVTLGPVNFRDRLMSNVDRTSGFWASDIEVAVSDFALGHMRRRLHAKGLVRIYNGIDLDTYSRAPGSGEGRGVTIGCAGRLVEGKGIDILLRAFSAGAADEGARLRIAGDGPTRRPLQRLSQELHLNELVEFTGSIGDMPSFWRACDIATQPSAAFVESFGMAAVEAMACARPVVVTANGALPEVVEDGATGLVVPGGDVDALADALVALTRDPARRVALGDAARARCEQRFDLRDCAATYVELFRNPSTRS